MKNATRNLIAIALLGVPVAGCSFGEPARYAVNGTVTMDGAPAPFVVVSFRSPEANARAGGSGPTDASGKFTIGETGKDSGLPAGEYKVTFSQTLVRGKPTLAGSGGKPEEKVKTEKEAVPDDYRDPQKTPITATVGSGDNRFTFDIKVKK